MFVPFVPFVLFVPFALHVLIFESTFNIQHSTLNTNMVEYEFGGP